MGSVEVHVRMSPMAAPTYEDGKLGSKGIELMRVLEILLRDCGVIDLESLCIRKYKQIWSIRVDVHILDDDGSLIDCASVAVLTALVHFKRPDVNVLSDSVIIYGSSQKMPIPLNIYHLPICVSFGVYDDTQPAVLDPTDREEMCLKGTLIVAVNKRHEICTLHQTGNLVLNQDLIMQCVETAMQRAINVSELISSVITDDNLKRSNGEEIAGFSGLVSLNILSSHQCEPNELIAPAVKNHALIIGERDDKVLIEEDLIQIGSEDQELIEQIAEITVSQKILDQSYKGRTEMDDVNDLLDSIEENFANSHS